MPNIEYAAPQLQRSLKADDGSLLDPKDVLEDGSRLLLLTRKPEELWELSMQTPQRLRRISEPRQFGQASVFAMAAHSSGISFLGVDGRLRVMRPDAAAQLARTVRAYPPMHRPLALGEWAGGMWIAVHSVVSVQGATSFTDSILISTLDAEDRVTRVYAFERAGPTHPGALFVDRVYARALRDRIVLVGSEPARVISVTAGQLRVDTLLDPPMRTLSAEEVAQLQRAVSDPKNPPFARESPLPTHQAPAVAALPLAEGYLVVAESGEDQYVADLYCGRRFRRTVLSRTSISGIYVTENGLAVIDEGDEGSLEAPLRLSWYRASDIIAECAQ